MIFRWVGLVLAIAGAVIAVITGFNNNFEVAIIGILLFIVGIFILSRPNF